MVSDRNPKMKDEDILKWAVAENRVIVTTDNDFEQMIWQQNKPHCGVLRLENLPRNERKIFLLEDALRYHRQDLETGAVVIASKTKFRIRKPLSDLR
jgi:predicted nuclease of predicted toxin-antitoxin system